MSKVIYKYILDVDDGINEISLPKGSEVVGCIFQEDIDKASIYVLHDSKPILCDIEKRLFKIYATGETIDSNIEEYVGKFEVGKLVFHILELSKRIDEEIKINNGDIRDIDLAMIATLTNDKARIEEWAKSNVPYAISGIDSYSTKNE